MWKGKTIESSHHETIYRTGPLGHSLRAVLAHSLVIAVTLSAYLAATTAVSAIGFRGDIDPNHDFCLVYATV